MSLLRNCMQYEDVPGPVPRKFDSCKRPPPVSDHSVFAFRVVAYGRFSFLPGHWTDDVMRHVEDTVITML